MEDPLFMSLVEEFSLFPQVDTIMLSGSRTNNTWDKESDYDLYIYISQSIPPEERTVFLNKYCKYIEINNTFWETEDDGILSNNIPIDIIYRNLSDMEKSLENLLENYQASTGYTTCFWANLLNSRILFDRKGQGIKLQKRFNIPYPDKLVTNVIEKNYPLLKAQLPAYYFQIEKAIKRKDLISINHRIAAFLESYFDILFAINKIPHPGEKKMLDILLKKGKKLPDNIEKDIKQLLNYNSQNPYEILETLNSIIAELDVVLIDKDLGGLH